MSKIAIITARGGSKRVPRKNVKPFHGLPMFAWPLKAALGSGLFDAVLVSTDDEEIARLAREFGAEVPFRRPAELSGDHTATIPVVRHAVSWWLENRGPLEAACCLYPTAPFVRAEDLVAGYQALIAQESIDYAVSVTSFPFPIFRAVRRAPDGRLSMFWPENEKVRSQDLPEACHDAAMFYWGRPAAWLGSDRFFTERSVGVPVPRYRVQDIDTPEDWTRAELMAKLLLKVPDGANP